MMFKSVQFYTNKFKLLKRFYKNILELNVENVTDQQFSVTIGDSAVTFTATEQSAFYHFAINIPGNQFFIMKEWIQDRIPLNKEGGINEIYSPSFDADSMFIEDPAGNVIKLIGRRKRDLFGALTSEAFLNVSEVAIVTPFVKDVGEQLQDFGLPLRHGTEVNTDSINYIGRGDRFITLAPPQKKWDFSNQATETHPLQIILHDNSQVSLDQKGKVSLVTPPKEEKEENSADIVD